MIIVKSVLARCFGVQSKRRELGDWSRLGK